MPASFAATYRLVPRSDAGLCCDEAGLALGLVPLVTWRDEDGGDPKRYDLNPTDDIADALTRAYGALDHETLERRIAGLARVAAALDAGDPVRARIAAVQLRFPEIAPEGMAKLARAPSLRKIRSRSTTRASRKSRWRAMDERRR